MKKKKTIKEWNILISVLYYSLLTLIVKKVLKYFRNCLFSLAICFVSKKWEKYFNNWPLGLPGHSQVVAPAGTQVKILLLISVVSFRGRGSIVMTASLAQRARDWFWNLASVIGLENRSVLKEFNQRSKWQCDSVDLITPRDDCRPWLLYRFQLLRRSFKYGNFPFIGFWFEN